MEPEETHGGGHDFVPPSIGVGRPNTVLEGHSAFPRTKNQYTSFRSHSKARF